jgi:hypothetical protein
MNTEMKNSVTRSNPGFICKYTTHSGILKVEDWLFLKASLLE